MEVSLKELSISLDLLKARLEEALGKEVKYINFIKKIRILGDNTVEIEIDSYKGYMTSDETMKYAKELEFAAEMVKKFPFNGATVKSVKEYTLLKECERNRIDAMLSEIKRIEREKNYE